MNSFRIPNTLWYLCFIGGSNSTSGWGCFDLWRHGEPARETLSSPPASPACDMHVRRWTSHGKTEKRRGKEKRKEKEGDGREGGKRLLLTRVAGCALSS